MALLYAPKEYWLLSDEERDDIVGGCGPGKGWKEYLVPDKIWGLNIIECCKIHDYMYFAGKTHLDKEQADRVFLYNMLRLIDYETNSVVLKFLRQRRAWLYYQAVSKFGGPAFWANKNEDEEMKRV